MSGGLANSVAEAALLTWMDSKPDGYVLEERHLPGLLSTTATLLLERSVPQCAGDVRQLFITPSAGVDPVFVQLLRVHSGKVHFLYFWKAFSEAARIAGANLEEGLTPELETLRDAILRRLDEGPLPQPSTSGSSGSSGGSSSSSNRNYRGQHRALPTWTLIEEVHRAASMSGHPLFWKAATTSLTGTLELQEIGIGELTSVLLSWLHDAPMWEQVDAVPRQIPKEVAVCEEPGLQVRLHIYDVSQEESIQRINRILAHKHSPVKLGGVFHAGVEVNGLEWSFGYSPSETRSGVSCVEPRTHPQHHYRQSVDRGKTKLGAEDIAEILSHLVEEYPGDDYDLLRRNCCHFADDFCRRLGVGGIPGWVHRLARIGATVDSILQVAPRPIKDRIYGMDGF